MRLTIYGRSVVIKALIVTLIIDVIAILVPYEIAKFILLILSVLLISFTFYFFRDPIRHLPDNIKENDIDVVDGIFAVASALIVASAKDSSHRNDVPNNLHSFIEENMTELQALNTEKIIRILILIQDDSISELAKLWKENEDDYPMWIEYIKTIIKSKIQ